MVACRVGFHTLGRGGRGRVRGARDELQRVVERRESVVDAACVSSQVWGWGSVTWDGGLDVGGRHSRTAANGMMCTRRRDDSGGPANRRRPSAGASCRWADGGESEGEGDGIRNSRSGTEVRGCGCGWPVPTEHKHQHKAAVAGRGTQVCKAPGGGRMP